MYYTLLDFVQEREPDYGKWTYEEQQSAPDMERPSGRGVVDVGNYQDVYDPPKQAESARMFARFRTVATLTQTLFYHHADSPDGGGAPYSVGPVFLPGMWHWSVAPDGSWVWSPRGWLDTQNPTRDPIARRLPSSFSAGIPEIGQEG